MEIGADFDRAVREGIREAVTKAIRLAVPRVEREVRDITSLSLLDSPEAHALMSGELRQLFGLERPQEAVSAIVRAVVDGIIVSVLPPAGESLGGLRVELSRDDYSDVFSSGGASYVSRSLRRGTEIAVPWLNWLLLAGDQIVIADWEYKQARGQGTRAGGVMVLPTRRAPQGFRVPPQFSGTVNSNWLLKTFEGMAPKVQASMAAAIGGF